MFTSHFYTKRVSAILVLLCCICSTSLSAQLLEQHITFEVKEKSIQNIFNLIEGKSNTHIAYSSKLLDADRIVSLSIRDESIASVLQKLFPKGDVQYKEIGQQLVLYAPSNGSHGGLVAYKGYIREKESNNLIANASIYLPELGIGTNTNANGAFSLTVPDGAYTMMISSLGYEGVSYSVVLKRGMRLAFQLEKIITPLDEVVVTVDGREKDRMLPHSPSFLIDMEIPKVIYNKLKATHLIVANIRSNDDWIVNFSKGNTPSQNLTLLDQGQVYTTKHLHSFSTAFHNPAITTQENPGSTSSQYGGRLGAVQHLEVDSGNKKRLEGELRTGIIASSLWLSGPLKKRKTSFFVSARGTYTDLLANLISSNEENTSYYEGDVQAKLHHVFKNKDELSFSGFYNSNQFKQKEGILATFTGADFSWSNISTSLNWKHQFSDQLSLDTSLLYTAYETQFSTINKTPEVALIAISEINSRIKDMALQLQFSYLWNPKHLLKFGVRSTYHRFLPLERTKNDAITQLETTDKLIGVESSAYIENKWTVSDKFTLTSGMRVDHFIQESTQYFDAAPHLGMSWRTWKDIVLQADYTISNQYTFTVSDAATRLPNDVWIMATDVIQPQKVQKSSIAVSKIFNAYECLVSGFYKKSTDVVAYRENASFLSDAINNTPQDQNWQNNVISGEGWAYGFNVLLKKTEGKFKGELSYQLSWARQQFEGLNSGQKFYDKNDRRHVLALNGKYQLSKRFFIGANWIASSGLNYNTVDPTQQIEQNDVKGATYHRLDIKLGYQKKTRKRKKHAFEMILYNAYGQRNPLFYELGYGHLFTTNKELLKSSYFSFVPALSYIYSF